MYVLPVRKPVKRDDILYGSGNPVRVSAFEDALPGDEFCGIALQDKESGPVQISLRGTRSFRVAEWSATFFQAGDYVGPVNNREVGETESYKAIGRVRQDALYAASVEVDYQSHLLKGIQDVSSFV